MAAQLLEARGLERSYGSGETRFDALKDVTVSIDEGDSLAIVGESGSGKSTLLHILGALDRPDAGEVLYRGEDVNALSVRRADQLRNREFGFVFQQFFLDDRATVLENVTLPLTIRGVPTSERRTRTKEVLDRLTLGNRIDERTGRLSGGQRQRVAIARALIGDPQVIFADEPTGALDRENGDAVAQFLFDLNQEDGLTLVLVTHSEQLASRCAREVRISDGHIISQDDTAPARQGETR